MGRPIKKKWFSAKVGSTASGDLRLRTENGDFTIRAQKGTGKYIVDDPAIAPNHVTLTDDVTPTGVEAYLTHNGKSVRKITQYQMYYFDGTFGMWNDGSGTATGTFDPTMASEAIATALASIASGAVTGYTVINSGIGYAGIPVVTVGAPDVTSSTTASLYVGAADGSGSVAVDVPGGGYTVAPVVTQSGGTGTGATFTATISAVDGSVTGITGDGGGASYAGDETFTIATVVLTQAVGTAVMNGAGDEVASITNTTPGAGYATAPAVTVAAP